MQPPPADHCRDARSSLPGAAHGSAGGYRMSFSASRSIHFLLLPDPLPLARSHPHVRLGCASPTLLERLPQAALFMFACQLP